MRPYTSGTEIVRENLLKFPDIPTMTLAKKIYKEHSKYFRDLESVRSAIRRVRGQSGELNRNKTTDKSFFTKPGTVNPFNLPDSVDSNFEDFRIDDTKGLIISDLHFPYQDNQDRKSTRLNSSH